MKTRNRLAGIAVCFGVLVFSVQAQVIPNYDFESWTNGTNAAPDNWQGKGSHHAGFYPVTRSADHCLGNYSVRLENKITDGDTTKATIKSLPPNASDEGLKPGFPINSQYRTLKGFYKFAPQGGDSAVILAMMFLTGYVNPQGNGNLLAGGWCVLGAASVFTPFSTSDFYAGGTYDVIPDSALINICAYKYADFTTAASLPVKGNSVLYVDALNFDTYLSTSIRHDEHRYAITQNFQLLPTSNNGGYTARFETSKTDYTTVKIFDMGGREQKLLFSGDLSAGKHEMDFETTALGNGAYLFVVASGSGYRAENLTIRN